MSEPKTPEPTKSLAARLIAVMSVIDHVEKRGHNQNGNYPFATADDVMDAAHKALVGQGVLLTLNLESVEWREAATKSGNTNRTATATVKFTFEDETGNKMERMFKGEGSDVGDKALQKAVTSAHKFFLVRTFHISTGERDADTEFDGGHHAPPKKFPRSGSTPPPARAPGSAGGSEGATAQTTPPIPAVAPEVPPSMVESSIAAAEAVLESDDGARAAYTKVVALIKAQPDVKERARLRGLYDASWMRRFPKRTNKHPETV